MGVMKLNQDKDQRNKELTLKIIVSVFAIISFLTFSVQLKDGLLGQTTTFNSCLKSFSSSFNELKVWICGGLATLTGVVITKPLYNAFNYFNHIFRKFVRIILDRIKWRRLTWNYNDVIGAYHIDTARREQSASWTCVIQGLI